MSSPTSPCLNEMLVASAQGTPFQGDVQEGVGHLLKAGMMQCLDGTTYIVTLPSTNSVLSFNLAKAQAVLQAIQPDWRGYDTDTQRLARATFVPVTALQFTCTVQDGAWIMTFSDQPGNHFRAVFSDNTDTSKRSWFAAAVQAVSSLIVPTNVGIKRIEYTNTHPSGRNHGRGFVILHLDLGRLGDLIDPRHCMTIPEFNALCQTALWRETTAAKIP